MSRFRFSNRASALITTTCNSTDTVVFLETGAGAKLPVLTGTDVFRATLISADGTHEIVNCTSVVADAVSIERGQEGTPASTFAIGSRFEVRMTAGVADNFLQKSGDAMQGPLDLGGFPIQRAVFEGPQSFTNIHVQLIRSVAVPTDAPFVNTENTINIPLNTNPGIENRRPRYMGRPIMNTQMLDGIVMMWSGDVNAVPTHLRLCNGTAGTPDLRNKFIRGWSDTFGVGATGGAETYNSSAAGAHDHTATTAPWTLTIEQIPPHAHIVTQIAGTGGTEGSDGTFGGGNRATQSAGGGQPHAHGIAAAPAHTHVTNAIPPFYALAYVMINV